MNKGRGDKDAECKKKLYIITQHYPYGDGEKTFIEPELNRLCATGQFDITIISSEKNGSELTSEVDKSVKVKKIPITSVFEDFTKFALGIKYGIRYFFSKDTKYERLELKKDGITLGKLFYSLIFFIQANTFYHDAMKLNLDMDHAIIYTYWFHTQTLAFALHKSELRDIKLISRIHGYDLYDDRIVYGRHPFRALVDNKLDKLFFIAEAGLEYYVDKIGKESNSKYILSRLGTECVESYDAVRVQQKKTDSYMLVSCSNLVPGKRVELIIQALSLIDKTCIQWVHFGDGDARNELEEMASKLLAGKDNIQYDFKGKTHNQEILSFYKSYLVGSFITTSQSEGCPVSVQEAMSFGLPIIATAVGEIPFMVDGNGILLSGNPTPDEVASAIEQMSSTSVENIDGMRKKSRDLWEKYFNAEKNYSFFIDKLVRL